MNRHGRGRGRLPGNLITVEPSFQVKKTRGPLKSTL